MIAGWVTRHYPLFIILFLVILGPALYGYNHTNVYYDLAGTLPKSLDSVTANEKLDENFQMGATHMIIANSDLPSKDAKAMLNEIEQVDGVKMALDLTLLWDRASRKQSFRMTSKIHW